MPDTANISTTTAIAIASATVLKPITARLKDLDVAPENPRFLEGPDDLIPDLATSLAPDAAGLLVPLLVRAGVKKEKPFMALDGRRRLFGFRHLLSQGLVTEDLEISAYLCETPESIAAAAITANQARLPLKPVEIILAIRALAAKKITVEAMSRALCMDIAEARKYHAVSQVHMDVIRVYRPTKTEVMFDTQFEESHWREVPEADWRRLWQQEVDDLDPFVHSELNLVSGLLLPIWKSLPDRACRVKRLRAPDGKTWLGRVLSETEALRLLQQLGVADVQRDIANPISAQDLVMKNVGVIRLAQGLRMTRSKVMDRYRLEIGGANGGPEVRRLKDLGCFVEIINHSARVFLPVGDMTVLGAVLGAYPAQKLVLH